MQTMSMNTTRQLVADRQAALGATARRGCLRRLLARNNRAQTVALDLTVLEHADTPTPAVIVGPRPAPAPVVRRGNKVA